MHYIRYGNSVFFCKIYTVFVGSLFYRLAHKKIPYAVCWKASKTSKTLISKRRTLGDIAIRLTFRTTRIKVNTDSPPDNRKLINGSLLIDLLLVGELIISKTANINVKKLQFIHMLTARDLRTSKTAKKVILLYCCTLTYDDVQ